MFRPAIRSLAGAVVVVTLSGVAGCAPANTTSTGADIGRARSVGYGVIVSIRPVTAQRSDVRADILGAIGGVAGTAAEPAAITGSAMEFIIREDSGQIISVVQANDKNFHPGERVVLAFGARTRIARVPG
jgi:outer membrane lipoprotein SlyB